MTPRARTATTRAFTACFAALALIAPLAAQAQSGQTPRLDLNVVEAPLLTLPGVSRSFNVLVDNPSDVPVNARIEATLSSQDPWVLTNSPQEIRLDARAKGGVYFILAAPNRVGATAVVEFIARDLDNPSREYARAQSVASVATLAVSVDPASADFGPGQSRAFDVEVQNNVTHGITMDVRASLSEALAPHFAPLPAHERVELHPGDAYRYTVTLTAKEDSPHAVEGALRILVTAPGSTIVYGEAVSQIRTMRPGGAPFTPAPSPTPRLGSEPPSSDTIRFVAPASQPVTLSRGEATTIGVPIVNSGTRPEPLSFEAGVEGAPGVEVRIEPPAFTLAEGEKRELTVMLAARPDAVDGRQGRLILHARAQSGTILDTVEIPFAIGHAPDPAPATLESAPVAGTVLAPGALIAVASTGVLGAMAVAALNWRRDETWQYLTPLPLIGLFTRFGKPEVLEHDLRERIRQAILSQPGVTFTQLKRAFALNVGTLTHHLRMLERHQYVTSRREGRSRRFYPVGPRLPPPAQDPVTPMQSRILELLDAGPLPQRELAERLGVTKQAANYHVKTLERKGLLRIEHDGQAWVCVRVPRAADDATRDVGAMDDSQG